MRNAREAEPYYLMRTAAGLVAFLALALTVRLCLARLLWGE